MELNAIPEIDRCMWRYLMYDKGDTSAVRKGWPFKKKIRMYNWIHI